MKSKLKLTGVVALYLCMAVSTAVPAFARDIERETHLDGGGGGGGGRIDMPRDNPLPNSESPGESGQPDSTNTEAAEEVDLLSNLLASPDNTNAPESSEINLVGLRDYVANKGGRLGTGQRDVVIEAHGICRWLDNLNATTEYFVPFATANEWQAFIDNAPSSVVRDNCCPTRNVDLAATDGQSRSYTLPVGREGATDSRGRQTLAHSFTLAASVESVTETYVCQAGAWVSQGANIISTATTPPSVASSTCMQASVHVTGLELDTQFRKIATNTYRYGTKGDNYWSGRCAKFDRVVNIEISDPAALREFRITAMHWDDYMRVKINGVEVANLPYDHKGEVRGNRMVLSDDTTKTCELSKNWSYTLPTNASGPTEYGSGAGGRRNKGKIIAGDLRPYLVAGRNTIEISVHVWDAGEGFVDFIIDAGANDVPVCSESTPDEPVDTEFVAPTCRYESAVVSHDIDFGTCIGGGPSFAALAQFYQDYNAAGAAAFVPCDSSHPQNVGQISVQYFVTGSSHCPMYTLHPGSTTSECRLVCS